MSIDSYRDMIVLLNDRYPGKDFLSRLEAATVLGVSPRAINQMIRAKVIKAVDLNPRGANHHYIIAKTEIARCGT